MLHAYRSEWPKIRRRSILFGGLAMSFFSLLFVPLGIIRATSPSSRIGGPADLTARTLSGSEGLTSILIRGATLTAVIGLVLMASATAVEYTHGTLRNLLVRQSGRLHLLAGKFGALLTFVLISATVAYGLGMAAAFVTASARGVDTAAWTSSDGLQNLAGLYGNVLLATCGYSIFGFVSALVFRSAAAAVAVPMAYVIIVETLIGAIWTDAPQWLFGQLVASVMKGKGVLAFGSGSASYERGLFLAGLYVLLFAVVGGVLFRRRDVSA